MAADRADLKRQLRAEAMALGFHDLRVTTPDAIGEAGARLRHFLSEGQHGDMAWMARDVERRADPRLLWPDVRSILMLGASYAPQDDPLEKSKRPHRGAISVYAQSRDYHDVVKRGLIVLARRLGQSTGEAVKVFVDTAPLMEKPLAAAAGLGWQGRHTNLVSRSAGSWLFLGAILTSACLEADGAEIDHCGSCRRCLDVCPTAAFPAPYRLDARRCIAYLTIEHKGHIATEFREPIGNRVFGCDDCLAVCPWNKFARAAHASVEAGRATDTAKPPVGFSARPGTDDPPLRELLALDDAAFRQRFAGTPIKRTGRDRFVRNVAIAAGNSGDITLLPILSDLLGDASPLVRAMAVWACSRLADPAHFREMHRRFADAETDADVRAEWSAASTA